MSIRRFRLIFGSLIAMGLVCGSLYAVHQRIGFDQLQMLKKGYEVTQLGQWTPYGNLSSGGLGNTPGYLSAFVVAAPLLVWDSPVSPMLALGLLMLAAYLLLDNVIKHAYGDHRMRIFFGVLYWLNPWFMAEVQLWNPSYLFVGSALHVWTAVRMNQKRSFWITMLHVLAVGAAAQMHLSALILFLMSLYLFYRGVLRVHWGGVVIAVSIWLLSLLPYFLLIIEHPDLINQDIEGKDYFVGRGLVYVYPVLKTILYWFRLGSTFFSKQLMFLSHFDWLESLGWLQSVVEFVWRALLIAIGLTTLWFSVLANRYLWQKIKHRLVRKAGPVQSTQELLMIYTFSGFLSLLICGIISPISFLWWHVLIIYHSAVLPVMFFVYDRLAVHPKKYMIGFSSLAVYFVAVNLVSAHGSGRYSYEHMLTTLYYTLP